MVAEGGGPGAGRGSRGSVRKGDPRSPAGPAGSPAMRVIVVESPAKAKTVGRYLGRDHRVLACYGHVSDLPAKAGSVRPDEDFAMTYATTGRRAARALGSIRTALAKADGLVLATDPDREGEAIACRRR